VQVSVIPFYTLSYKIKPSHNTSNRASPLFTSVASRENKNRYLFAYLKSLVDCGIFDHIYLNFLPVGHTHCDIDQLFSRVATFLKGEFTLQFNFVFRSMHAAACIAIMLKTFVLFLSPLCLHLG